MNNPTISFHTVVSYVACLLKTQLFVPFAAFILEAENRECESSESRASRPSKTMEKPNGNLVMDEKPS